MKQCFECGLTTKLHKHHVVPRSLGGKKTVWLCEEHHGLVHDRKFLNHSVLTKQGLSRAKANGVVLGNIEALRKHRNKDTTNATKQKMVDAETFAKSIFKIIKPYILHKTNTEIANYLNNKGYKTACGKKFGRAQVWRIVNRFNKGK